MSKEEIVIKKGRVAETKTITEEVKSEKLVDDSRGDNFK
jgi:stress response protein YsnF